MHTHSGPWFEHRHRLGQQIDGLIRGDREVAGHQLVGERLVEQHQLRRFRQRLRYGSRDRPQVTPHGLERHGERNLRCRTGTPQGDTDADRTDELPLDRPAIPALAGDFEERAQPDEVVAPQIGDDGRSRVEPVDVDGNSAVLTECDASSSDQRLGDRGFGR